MAKSAMVQKTSRQRIYAALLALGAGILLMRTLRMMLVEGAFELLVWWVVMLLIIRMVLGLVCRHTFHCRNNRCDGDLVDHTA